MGKRADDPILTGEEGEVVITDPPAPTETVTLPTPVTEPPATVETVEDDPMKDPRIQKLVENARKQEKDKLYGEIQELKEFKNSFEQERLTAQQAEEERRRQAEEEQRKAQEEELSAKELLARREEEWNARLSQLEQERETERALREKEAEFNELATYRNQRLDEESDNIIPNLAAFVAGNTKEEIETSIQKAIAASAEILEASTSAMQHQRQQMPGSRVTAPTASVLDTDLQQVTLTPDQIRGMSMDEYAKNRDSLMNAASRNARGLG